MNIEQVIDLIKSPLINRAELARRMFPENKTPEQALNSKLANSQNRRITKKDCEKVINILTEEIEEIVPNFNPNRELSNELKI